MAPVPGAAKACRSAVQQYRRDRSAFVARLRSRIDRELKGWRTKRSRIAIYGAGYHTECLLDATQLRDAELVALVDGNPAKQGTEVFGLPVVGPRDLAELRPDAVVV